MAVLAREAAVRVIVILRARLAVVHVVLGIMVIPLLLHPVWKLFGYQRVERPITFVERRQGQSKVSRAVLVESLLTPWRLRLSRRG